ncbi:MAG: DUF2188 domain-containing protein [Armatimonadetes bacterium]|nr:DUF2188 domain-containing protein [Armatimonadota bacterium]
MAETRTVHVVPTTGGWMMEEEGGGSPSSSVFSTKAEAMTSAHELVEGHPWARVLVHRADGSVESESWRGRTLHSVLD